METSVLFHLLFQVALLFDALAWEVKMPKEIHGLRGSCLVIPCSFSYSSNPPKNPRRVVWYQWVSSGYPLVYDPLHTNDVIVKFRGKTYLYGNSSRDCSLLIKTLEQTHNKEKLYTWIDPENVGHKTYSFYDVTSTILVDAHPQLPEISISGGERMGDTITVTCSTSHTCPYSKPNITLNGIEGSDHIENDCNTNGQCRTTLTREGVIKAANSTIECSVTHHGGIRATASDLKTALCIDSVFFGQYILTPLLVLLLICALAGVIIHKKRRRSKRARIKSENKPLPKPRMQSPKSDPQYNPYSTKGYECEAECTDKEDFSIYEI